MKAIKTHYKIYVLAVILCIGMSGSFIIAGSSSSYAKSIPESIADWVTSRKNPKTDDKKETAKVATPTQITSPATATSAPQNPSTSRNETAAATTIVSTPVEPSNVPDTSGEVRQVATAQAVKTNLPSSYPTSKISTTERDDLYKASLIIAGIGGILYLLSFAPSMHWMYKSNGIGRSKIITE